MVGPHMDDPEAVAVNACFPCAFQLNFEHQG